MSERCELSELPVEMCDHCRKRTRALYEGNWNAPAYHEEEINFYKESDRAGQCLCGTRFKKGDMIGWDKANNWWRAEKCCG